jgi:Holliday junction resolvase RusA-like endonuclease
MSTLLLITKLSIPPSVNHRVIINAHGGTLHPEVRQFYADAHNILLSTETTLYADEIVAARERADFLSVSMWFYLPEARTPKRSGPFFLSRDLDNMQQLPINSLKQFLGIDDVRIIDIHTYKRPLAANERGYVLVVVSALEEYTTNENTLASLHPTNTANAIQTSISHALAHIESAMASSTSRVTDVAASDDA